MRILLAEDEKSLNRALVAILQKSNYAVDSVFNGVDAWEYASVGNYDCIILDVMMPGMDGFSVLKKIRDERINIPVLMLTAKGEIDDKVYGLDCGANDYLTKPFDTKELLARIRVLTRNTTTNHAAVLVAGNTTLNQTNFTLCTENKQIELPNKEFQMVEMLFINPGQIISAYQFMDHIWGLDSDIEESTVWLYISNLRRRLKSIDSNLIIKAIRNFGYKLEVQNDKDA